MPGSVIVAGARTPIGKLSGAFAGFAAMDLGGFAIKAALERAGVAPDAGRLRVHGPGAPGRPGPDHGPPGGGEGRHPDDACPPPPSTRCACPASTAIYLADQMIAAGDADIVVAGGMESMTNAPYLLPGARAGYRMGDNKVVDAMMYDGLFCAFDMCAMGAGTEKYTKAASGITRDRQDEFAAASHERASAGHEGRPLRRRDRPVEVPQRKGDPIVVDTDEGVRPGTTAESLGKLRPAFDADGTITAGNASQISDGGAARDRHVEGRGRAARASRRSARS